MTMDDPTVDIPTKVRNVNTAKHDVTDIPASKMRVVITDILVNEGYVEKHEFTEDKDFQDIRITLKYGATKDDRILSGLKRIPKPDLRIHAGKEDIPRVLGGPGTVIISANQGIITGKEAHRLGVGGEVSAFIW